MSALCAACGLPQGIEPQARRCNDFLGARIVLNPQRLAFVGLLITVLIPVLQFVFAKKPQRKNRRSSMRVPVKIMLN